MTGAASSRLNVALGAAGAALAAQLLVLRALSAANDDFVTLAGTELHWGCVFKTAFGVPCPNCGMTRAVVFALHGDWSRAFAMNPGGPLLVLGAVLLSAALLYVALRAPRGTAARQLRRVVVVAAAYGGLVFVVQLANWVRVIS